MNMHVTRVGDRASLTQGFSVLVQRDREIALRNLGGFHKAID